MVLVARDMIWRGAEAALLHRRPYPHTKAMGDGVAQIYPASFPYRALPAGALI